MLRRLGIRGKVLAALSVPVLVLFLLAGLVSVDSVQQARTAQTMGALLGTIQESRDLVLSLQAERRAAVEFANGNNEIRGELDSARAMTDDAIRGYERSLRDVNFAALDPTVRQAVDRLSVEMRALVDARQRTDARSVNYRVVLTDYTRLIQHVVSLAHNVSNGLDDRRLAEIIAAQADVTALVENYREEQGLGAEILKSDERTDAEILYLSTFFPITDRAHLQTRDAVRNLGLGDDVVVPPLGTSWRLNTSFDTYRSLVSYGSARTIENLQASDWVERSGEEIDAIDAVQGDLRRAANERAAAIASSSLRGAALTIGAALAAVVLSIVIALTIARQIVNPLRRLTAAAGHVRDELPRLVDQVAIPGQGPDLRLEPIPVTSQDEIGMLATAFNEVNSTTIQVAQEQAALRGSIAEMFVNVARRDQVLLNRQLSFIDALERSEEDPKTLADLFRLDHLATRMRRNAESLLVLAGIDTGRRLRDAMPLSDVIRTASSEIEHYERVQLDLPVDPHMVGHTALAAAHMLAEVLENATVFSDPGTPVHVSTGVDRYNVLVTILDQGLGMTPQEIEAANTKIAATSAGDVLGSQRLGLFVVGRIASRLGARVEISLGPDGRGTLVTVRMPLVLFVEADKLPFTPPNQASHVESFVLPEEAAAVAHEAAYAPVPDGVQDVAPGSLGSAQNPAQEVDLAALTDGSTGLGLPRRRSASADHAAAAPSERQRREASQLEHREADDAAAASSIPLAPRADALAGATLGDEEVWTPPVVEPAAPLSSRRAPARPAPEPQAPVAPPAPSGPALPTRTPTGGPSLPSRTQAAPMPVREQPSGTALPTRQPAGPAQAGPVAAGSSTPAPDVDTRAAMFSGFRSRRAELAAAAIRVDSPEDQHQTPEAPPATGDGAERLAAAAAFFSRPVAPRGQDEPRSDSRPSDESSRSMVIPQLVEEEADYGTPVFAPGASAMVVEPSGPEYDGPREDTYASPERSAQETPAAAAQVEEDVPYFGRHAYLPEDRTPDTRPASAASSPPAHLQSGEPAQQWAQPAYEQPAYEQPAYEQPAESTQQWAQPADATEQWAQPVESQHHLVDEQSYAQPASDQMTDSQWWANGASAVQEAQPAPGGAPWPPAAAVTESVAPSADAQPWQDAPAPTSPAWGTVSQAEPVQAAPAAETKKGKRRLFGLLKPKADAVEQPAPAPAPAPQVASTADHVVAPVRQSAWNSSEGAHSLPAPLPAVVQAPAAYDQQQPALGALPVEPAYQVRQDVPTPWQPEQDASRPTAEAPSWSPPAWEAPAAALENTGEWSPSPAWSDQAPAGLEQRSPAPAVAPLVPSPNRGAFTPQASFTPESGFDDQMTNMLAQNADIAQQALSELSQLSSYRPKTVSAGAPSSLTRRTPGTIPAAPAIELPKNGQRVDRDANQVRSLLSSFQSGTSRGRQAADGTGQSNGQAPQNAGEGTRLAGHEDGSDVDRGEPVTTPDTDLTQRTTSW